MTITINGQSRDFVDGATVADLVAAHDLEPRRIAVEVNARLVTRATYASTPLRPGDTIEIVTLVGGG